MQVSTASLHQHFKLVLVAALSHIFMVDNFVIMIMFFLLAAEEIQYAILSLFGIHWVISKTVLSRYLEGTVKEMQ